MLRRLAKTGIACALHWTGANKLIGALNGSRNMPLVLGYHRVVEDYTASAGHYIPAMLTSLRMLERHLDWIGRRFRFISLDELGSRLERGQTFDKPVAAITFDDGYADVYHHAFPLLKRKGIPAGIFVVADLIDTERLQVYDKLYLLLTHAFSRLDSMPHALARLLVGAEVWPPNVDNKKTIACNPLTAMRTLVTSLSHSEIYRVIDALEDQVSIQESELKELHQVTWEMVFEMHRAGITVGSHTKNHVLLPNERWEKMLDETVISRRLLEGKLGTPIHHFAYPDGQFNAAAVSLIADAGYRFAYTTCSHRDPNYPLLTIPRKLLWENSCLDMFGRLSSSIMSCQAHGVFDFVDKCRQDHWSPLSASVAPGGGPGR